MTLSGYVTRSARSSKLFLENEIDIPSIISLYGNSLRKDSDQKVTEDIQDSDARLPHEDEVGSSEEERGRGIIGRQKNRGRLRSRNAYIDRHLEMTLGNDDFADLEDFIVS